MQHYLIALGLFVFLLSSCERAVAPSTFELNVDFDFESENLGLGEWEVFITDYGVEQEDLMEFDFGREALPVPLSGYGLMVEGHNRSDDMFIYMRRLLTDLPRSAEFELSFSIDLASAYPENSVGIGGSPGASVYLKAGAVPQAPLRILEDGFYTISIDKGNQSQGGADMVVLGSIGTQGQLGVYERINRSNSNTPMRVTSNAEGEIWLVVGIDSGFEGLTRFYFDRIRARLRFVRNISQ